MAGPAGEPTACVRTRVLAARDRQASRAALTGSPCNAELPGQALRRVARLGPAGERLLRRAVDRTGLTARGLDRLLRVARTMADLGARETISSADVAEALQFRCCMLDTGGRC